MTKDTTFQHVSSTHPSPRKHVVGVFDSLQEGEQAVQALVDAGYHAEDIAFIPSQDVPSAFQEHSRKEGLFWRIIHRLQVTTDEGSLEAVRKAFWSQVALMSCFALASHSRSQDEIFAFKWASLAEQVAQEANGNPTMGNGFSGLFVQPLVQQQ